MKLISITWIVAFQAIALGQIVEQRKPVRGEVWQVGTKQVIAWEIPNRPSGGTLQIGVRPFYRYSLWGAQETIVIPNAQSVGQYEWTVPETLRSGEYVLEIVYGGVGTPAHGEDKYNSFFVVEKPSKVSIQKERNDTFLEIEGGAKNTLYEIIASADLQVWQRTKTFVTNGIPFRLPDVTQFFRVASPLPVTLTLSVQGTLQVGQPVVLRADVTGGEKDFTYSWWYFDAEGVFNSFTNTGPVLTNVFDRPGSYEFHAAVYSGDSQPTKIVPVQIQ